MTKQYIHTSLPMAIIAFFCITKWQYVHVIDHVDEFVFGFPFIYKCSGFHTSLSSQYFVVEMLANFLFYLGISYLLVLLLNRFRVLSFPKLVLRIFWITFFIIFVGFLFLSYLLDDMYLLYLDFEIGTIHDKGISIFETHPSREEL